MKTILIHAAMDCELNYFLKYYKNLELQEFHDYKFYCGTHRGNNIIVLECDVGITSSAAATTLAIEKFRPDIIINEGGVGSHLEELHHGDIIIAKDAVYINNFKSNPKKHGEGSNPLEWRPSTRSYRVDSTSELVSLASIVDWDGKVVLGTIGSGDLFSKEVDRIHYLHSIFGESCEDMEAAAMFFVCEKYNIPRISFKVVVNNELTGEVYDKDDRSIEESLQKFVIKFVDEYIDFYEDNKTIVEVSFLLENDFEYYDKMLKEKGLENIFNTTTHDLYFSKRNLKGLAEIDIKLSCKRFRNLLESIIPKKIKFMEQHGYKLIVDTKKKDHHYTNKNMKSRIQLQEIDDVGLVLYYDNPDIYNLPRNEQKQKLIKELNEYGFNFKEDEKNIDKLRTLIYKKKMYS